jgi:hypothetical protein
MTELIQGLVSGLIWSAILGSCLIAIAAVITATASVGGRISDTAPGTVRDDDESPIPQMPRPAATAILHPTRPGPRPSSRRVRAGNNDKAGLPSTSELGSAR